MQPNRRGRLVILSGPSCVGKTPLRAALARLYPELWRRLEMIVLFNTRAPRPGERDGVDYHFRSRTEVEALQGSGRFAVLEVRGDLQALDVEELKRCSSEAMRSSKAIRLSAACCRRIRCWPEWTA
jgi:guanylate kinase